MHPNVVHCQEASYDVYIGRRNPRVRAEDTTWGNPFVIPRDGDRGTVLEKYTAWIAKQKGLLERARRELKGKVLGCWCAPLACHGDVLARIANEDVVPSRNFSTPDAPSRNALDYAKDFPPLK